MPPADDIRVSYARHAAAGVISTPLAERHWGEVACDAVIEGYRFLIAQEQPDTGESLTPISRPGYSPDYLV